MKRFGVFVWIIFVSAISIEVNGQSAKEVIRIEFNSGSRAFRQQTIITADSVIRIKEDFRIDLKPVIQGSKISRAEWKELLNCLGTVKLSDVPSLKSPSDKRTYDAASHGSIIITTQDSKSYSHGFDNEDPHDKLKPLMQQILKIR